MEKAEGKAEGGDRDIKKPEVGMSFWIYDRKYEIDAVKDNVITKLHVVEEVSE